ncbi:MAG: glycosyltransferase family 2 protein [Rhodothermales bacterium]
MKYSVVIPVYNSQDIVAETVRRTLEFFQAEGLEHEIVLVNDGSTDGSWDVIATIARSQKNVIAINLLKNYGQHTANLCGFREASGDYIITMDDDLQNPPEEISHLIAQAAQGYDLVIGQFRQKKHALYRRLGTLLVGAINRRIFGSPKDLVLTNFRIIRRDVVDRVCQYSTSYPYIPGLVLMFSHQRVNVMVEHATRSHGKSNYNMWKILKLVATILFNYSSYPLRLVAGAGLVIAGTSFLLGLYYLFAALVHGSSVPGWTTLVVLLSFFNGMTILMLSMLGEYSVRLISQISSSDSYHVKDRVQAR